MYQPHKHTHTLTHPTYPSHAQPWIIETALKSNVCGKWRCALSPPMAAIAWKELGSPRTFRHFTLCFYLHGFFQYVSRLGQSHKSASKDTEELKMRPVYWKTAGNHVVHSPEQAIRPLQTLQRLLQPNMLVLINILEDLHTLAHLVQMTFILL